MLRFRVFLITLFLHYFADGHQNETNVKKCCPLGQTFDIHTLTCQSWTEPFKFDFEFAIGTPKCSGNVLLSTTAKEFRLDTDGPKADGELLRGDYCVESTASATVIVSCREPSAVCTLLPCIRKCKPLGQFYGGDDRNLSIEFEPVFYNLNTLKVDSSVSVSNFGLYFGLKCVGGKIRLDSESDVNYPGTNGSLFAPGHRSEVFSSDEYCLEHVADEGLFTFLCLPEAEVTSAEPVGGYVVLALGFIASCVSLLATFVVYLCSRKSKSLYGKTLMCYVGCLCIAYLSLAVVHLWNHLITKGTCIMLGYSILLSFLAAFFWLNIMSIDIWKTFRSLRATDWRTAPNVNPRFTIYSVYGWGAPIGLTVICGILDYLPDDDHKYVFDLIKPKIGLNSCWFSKSTYGMYVFFVAPVSLIITCNIILYISTAWRCWKVKAEINRLGVQNGRNRGKFSVHRDQLMLNGKLFIVMGVSWGPEFLSNLFPHPVWHVTDALNTLLGVFIFIIFVLKKKVISNVTQKVRESLRQVSKKNSQTEFQREFFHEKKTCMSCRSSDTHTFTTNI